MQAKREEHLVRPTARERRGEPDQPRAGRPRFERGGTGMLRAARVRARDAYAWSEPRGPVHSPNRKETVRGVRVTSLGVVRAGDPGAAHRAEGEPSKPGLDPALRDPCPYDLREQPCRHEPDGALSFPTRAEREAPTTSNRVSTRALSRGRTHRDRAETRSRRPALGTARERSRDCVPLSQPKGAEGLRPTAAIAHRPAPRAADHDRSRPG